MDDEWELSAEELDSLERDALNQIAECNNYFSSSTSTSTTSFHHNHHSISFTNNNQHLNTVVALPQGSKTIPTSVAPKVNSGVVLKEQLSKPPSNLVFIQVAMLPQNLLMTWY